MITKSNISTLLTTENREYIEVTPWYLRTGTDIEIRLQDESYTTYALLTREEAKQLAQVLIEYADKE